MIKRESIALSGIVTACFLATASLQAEQIVVNGTFSAGLTDWTKTGNVEVVSSLSGEGGNFASGAITHQDDGVYAGTTGGNGCFAVLNYYNSGADTSVTLNQTDPNSGACYGTLSFDYNLFAHNDQGPGEFTPTTDGSSLKVYIGGNLVANVTYFDASGGGATDAGWQTFTMNLGTIPAGPITFDFNVADSTDPNAYYFGAAIDDISLEEFQCSTNVPDSSFALLLLGGALTSLWFMKRKMVK